MQLNQLLEQMLEILNRIKDLEDPSFQVAQLYHQWKQMILDL